jgi:hypothetical protein
MHNEVCSLMHAYLAHVHSPFEYVAIINRLTQQIKLNVFIIPINKIDGLTKTKNLTLW